MNLLASLAVLATLAGCKSSWPGAPAPIPAHQFMPGLQPHRTEMDRALHELPRARRAGMVEFIRSDARIARAVESFDFEQAFEILR